MAMDTKTTHELSPEELDHVVGGRGIVATVNNAIAAAETTIMLGVNIGLGALTSGAGGGAPKSTWL
jgi:hypothetical protein